VKTRLYIPKDATALSLGADEVAEAFAKAKHVTRLKTSNQRMVVNAIEPRAAIG